MPRTQVVSVSQGGSPDSDGPEPTLALERELKRLIIETLRLEPASAAAIEVDTPLFNDGVGLDSIDALQMAVAIERRYGVRIQPDDDRNQEILRSIRSLAQYILGIGAREL
jgi:acyl carrier protein